MNQRIAVKSLLRFFGWPIVWAFLVWLFVAGMLSL